MPVYEYQAKDPHTACDHCRNRFELAQPMSADPLACCPQCGQPVVRVISRCSVFTAQSVKSMLSDKNLKEKGFTKLVNEGDGKFRKTT